jgi:hypothetical protein
MRSWHAEHERGECVARRSGRTEQRGPSIPSDSVRLERLRVDAELRRKIASVRREYKPIPIGTESSPQRASNGWTRVDHDAWGARQTDGVRWVGGNCLKASIAHLISATDINAVPDNDDLAGNTDWLPLYNERLNRIGFRLEQITAELGLASRKTWIAVVVDDASAGDHAVVARAQYVLFDPTGQLQGGLPIARVRYGLSLAPTRRRVSVIAPA